MIKSILTDGSGSGKSAKIYEDALLVTQGSCPPLLPQKNKIFRQYMTNDGTSSGVWDMQVDAGEDLTDGACADHTGPTYTFTSATVGLTERNGLR